jgi:hypothetical protein
MKRPPHCWNCDDLVAHVNRVRLCPVCSRTYGWGAFIGGAVMTILCKVLPLLFHVL